MKVLLTCTLVKAVERGEEKKMGSDNLGKIEDVGLKDTVRTYFDGLNKGYSEETMEAHRKVLTTRYGINDFKKLRQDFKAGLFD